MLLDERTEFSGSFNIATDGAAGTNIVGDVIDLGATPTLRDLGGGEPLYVVIQVETEVITGGTAGTIKFDLVSDANASLNAAGTGDPVVAETTVHITTGTLVTDDAAANDARLNVGGVILMAALPVGSYERYLGIIVTIATTTVTAGKVKAFLTNQPAKFVHYPDAI